MSLEQNIRIKLLGLPRGIKRTIVILTDACLVLASVWLAYFLRIGEFIHLTRWTDEHFPLMAVFFGLLILPLFSMFGMYKLAFRYTSTQTFVSVANSIFIYFVVSVLVVTLVGLPGVPRTLGIIQPLVLFWFVATVRLFLDLWLGGSLSQFFRRNARRKVMIYGAGAHGRELAKSLASKGDALPVAFFDDDVTLHGQRIAGVKVYPSSEITYLSSTFGADEMLLALPNEQRRRRSEIVQSLAGSGLSVRTLPSPTDLVQGRFKVSEVIDLSVDEILGREAVDADQTLMQRDITGKTVLVTGAGGSIGSELCRQIIPNSPSTLLLFEQTEFTLYQIYEELKSQVDKLPFDKRCRLIMVLGSINNPQKIEATIRSYNVNTIYHAAAYKHVPIVEENPVEGIRTNVLGTYYLAEAATKLGVAKFVLISTDKAVRPMSIMGVSKRCAELVLQAYGGQSKRTAFAMVRFGNVLDSSGSVVPLFRKQIKEGGPVTLTHKEVTRYFMTLTEAAQLVIQAGAMTISIDKNLNGAPVYLLDMGAPVRIDDLARRMIELSGLSIFDKECQRDGDIEIKEIGLRPGEKLHEELLINGETQKTAHPKIKVAIEESTCHQNVSELIEVLRQAVSSQDVPAVRRIISDFSNGISFESQN